MKKIGIFMCAGVISISLNAFSAEMRYYEQIAIDTQEGQACLTLADNLTSVSLQRCSTSISQRWIFLPQHDRYYIKNMLLGNAKKEKCLFTDANRVYMADCTSSGGTDYQSKRLWSRETANPTLLSNKYVEDLRRLSFLQSDEKMQLKFGDKANASAKWTVAAPLYQEIINHSNENA